MVYFCWLMGTSFPQENKKIQRSSNSDKNINVHWKFRCEVIAGERKALFGKKEIRPFHHPQDKSLLIKRRPIIFGDSERLNN